jgi:antitoxin ParD1/3/4
MRRSTSFSLGDHFHAFVESQVAEGRYGNSSEVIRAGLRLLETQETQLAALRGDLIEGENSGVPTPFDFDEFIVRARTTETAS